MNNIQQNTPEWFEARLGKATASRFNDATAFLKSGAEAAARANYRAELVVERLTHESPNGFTSGPMQWGIDNEPLARVTFQLRSGLEVAECGFIEHPTLAAGASPDGLIGDDAILELKCPNTATHITTLQTKKLPNQYKAQVQGQLWITKRQRAYFASFDPRLPEEARMVIVVVERDDAYIEQAEADVREFLGEVDQAEQFLRGYKYEPLASGR